jgi:hypothetical protein
MVETGVRMDRTINNDVAGRAKHVKFIKDVVADADAFGTHQRIAEAVASVVQAQDSLNVIGLVGPWGSGKSTVIHLVEEILKTDKKHPTHVFVYDAWLHQNDPQRRSFLERLVSFLDLSQTPKWKEQLAALNGQIDETTSTSTPTLTKAGAWIVLSLFLIPIGLALVNFNWFNIWVPVPYLGFKIGIFWTGVCFLLLPIIIVFFLYCSWRPHRSPLVRNSPFVNREFFTLRNFVRHRQPHHDQSILSLFLNKAVQQTNHRVSRAPDPTTIEFQRAFRALLADGCKKNCRYIFVIDNLDRLPGPAAVEIWATIRSFFLGATDAQTSHGKTPLPTIILPIDTDAVRRMYAAGQPEEAEQLAQAFIDKTFDLSFRVPTPVFSNWRRYLADQMQYVFGDACDKNWVYQVGNLYDKYIATNSARHVTPRSVNTLLNSIAVQWLQWGAEIPFATLAYFVIYKDEILKDVGAFMRATRSDITEYDHDWPIGIAATYYGVPKSHAIQVHMTAPLTQALLEQDALKFAELAATPGFDTVFEDVLKTSDAKPEFISNAAMLFETLKLPNDVWVNSAWNRMASRLLHAGNWTDISAARTAGVGALIRNCSDQDLHKSAHDLAATATGIEERLFTNTNFGSEWAAFFALINDAFVARKVELKTIIHPGPAGTFLDTIEVLSNNETLIKLIQPKASDASIAQELATRLGDEQQADGTCKIIAGLLMCKSNWQWPPVTDAANQKMRTTAVGQTSAKEAIRALGMLRKQKGSGSAERLTALYSEGFLHERFAQAHNANLLEEEASLLVLLILTNPVLGNPGQPRSNTGWTLCNTLEAIILERPKLVDLTDMYFDEFATRGNLSFLETVFHGNVHLQQLIRSICTIHLDEKDLGPLAIKSVIAELPKYLDLFEPDHHDSFIQELLGYPTFSNELASAPLNKNVVEIYDALLASPDASIVKKTTEALVQHLQAIGQDQWELAIRDGAEPYMIANNHFTSHPGLLELGQPLYDGMSATIPSLIEASDGVAIGRWFDLSRLLSANGRQAVFKTVRDLMLRTGNSRLDILRVGSTDFLTNAHFEDTADEAARYLVVPLLSDPQGLNWLLEHHLLIAGWLKNAKDETRGFVRERMTELWSQGTEQSKKILEKLSLLWELPSVVTEPPAPPEEEENA